jgi:hypothetical protein
MTRLLTRALLLAACCLAPTHAEKSRQIYWHFTIDGSYKQGDKSRSLLAKPRVAAIVGSPAQISVGENVQLTDGEHKLRSGPGYSIRCNVKEVLPGKPTLLRIEVGLQVLVPNAPLTEQNFETLVPEGEPWHYRWGRVHGLDYLQVDGTPYLEPDGMQYSGADANGKPRWVPAKPR